MKINNGATPYSAPTVKFFSVSPRQCLMVSVTNEYYDGIEGDGTQEDL